MKVLIVANGEAPEDGLMKQLAMESAFVVAADGGSATAFSADITPDFIVGDLDSLPSSDFPDDRVVRLADQSTTDLEKAIEFCIERGATEVSIVGAGGRRADHALGNLSVLVLFRDRVDVRIIDDLFEISVVNGTAEVSGSKGTVVSLIALGPCEGVTTEGLRWKLLNDSLTFNPRGIHNELLGHSGRVTVRSGDLILFQSRSDRVLD